MKRIACHSISEQRKLLAEVLDSVRQLDAKSAANVKELEEKISRIQGR